MSSEQKDFVCEHLKIKSFNENYALATKFFQNRTQTKKKGKFFLFLIVYFVFFNEIYRDKNGIYRKNAQKISEKRRNFRFFKFISC
jgi:hypothetical protein